MELPQKVAAFCREVGDGVLEELAGREGQAEIFRRVRESLASGADLATLEADLDALDALAEAHLGFGIYPRSQRMVSLPGASKQVGARFWDCPQGLCSGRGRVRPDQAPPVCGVTGAPLVSEPLSQP